MTDTSTRYSKIQADRTRRIAAMLKAAINENDPLWHLACVIRSASGLNAPALAEVLLPMLQREFADDTPTDDSLFEYYAVRSDDAAKWTGRDGWEEATRIDSHNLVVLMRWKRP